MDVQHALDYLNSFINYERTTSWQYPEALKLDRMRALAKEFGNPHKAYECVLIAGSKGKGSVALMLSSILRMENLRTGLFTSPHLEDLRERIRVNGLVISDPRLVEYVLELRRVLEGYEWRKSPPTFFEALTVLALKHFKELKIEVAVLEVGLGGLYDSTNIVEAKVVGLAPISLEHTDKLGKTISKIAVQKCGIIKGRETVVSSPQRAEAEAVIQKAAQEHEAKLFRVGKEIQWVEREFGENYQKFDVRGELGNFFNLELELLGIHQIENAALAIGLAKALEGRTRMVISQGAVRQGLKDAFWPGRLEKICDKPKIVLDGAHNTDSVRRLAEAIKRHFHYEKLIVVLGLSQDKDLEGVLRELMPETSQLFATMSANPRALEAGLILEKACAYGKQAVVEKDPTEAFKKAIRAAGAYDLVLVAGSLFLVGEIRAMIRGAREPEFLECRLR